MDPQRPILKSRLPGIVVLSVSPELLSEEWSKDYTWDRLTLPDGVA